MASPENSAGQVIHTIKDRLSRAQTIRNTFGQPETAAESFGKALFSADTSIGRSSEAVIDQQKAEELEARSTSIRNWLIDHAPTYDEEPSFRIDDESGWAYRGIGFQVGADDITKPSSLSAKHLLCVTEVSPHDPTVHVALDITEEYPENRFSLDLGFFNVNINVEENPRKQPILIYRSEDKPFREMPEDDAVIIEDLLTRVSNHLAQEG